MTDTNSPRASPVATTVADAAAVVASTPVPIVLDTSGDAPDTDAGEEELDSSPPRSDYQTSPSYPDHVKEA